MLIGALLFMQFAVAAYACPKQSANPIPAAVSMAEDCQGIDRDQANLCKAHCDHGARLSSNAQSVDVPPAATAAFVVAWASAWPGEPGLGAYRPLVAGSSSSDGSPPVYLLHLVLRN